MTVIVCSYGKGFQPVSFSGSDCLPCLPLIRSIPRRIGISKAETRYSPAQLLLLLTSYALQWPVLALQRAGSMTTAGNGAAIVTGVHHHHGWGRGRGQRVRLLYIPPS
jgi:hypothetical protein